MPLPARFPWPLLPPLDPRSREDACSFLEVFGKVDSGAAPACNAIASRILLQGNDGDATITGEGGKLRPDVVVVVGRSVKLESLRRGYKTGFREGQFWWGVFLHSNTIVQSRWFC